MNTIAHFLQQLAQSGIQVALQGGRVHVRGPQEALTPDTRWLLSERREELLRWLSMAGLSSDLLMPTQAHSEPSSAIRFTTEQTFLPTIVSLAHAHCAHPDLVAIDLMTTGPDARKHKVVSLTLGVPGDMTILDLRPYYALPATEQARWREALCQLFRYGGTTWVGQSLQGDWPFLAEHFGARLDSVRDTTLAEQVLYGTRQEQEHIGFGLSDMAARYQIPISKEDDSWFRGLDERPIEWAAPFPDELLRSIVEHIEVSYWISHRQQALLKHHHLRQIAQLEYDCLPALASTKWYGALVDRKFCQQMLQSKQANHDTPAAVSSEQFACSDNLLHHIHDDGRIHPHFAQIGAVSGGVVCRKPDMQHMAQREQEVEEKDMRRCVIAPPGSLLLALDLSQIELRILAEISKDQTMLHLFAEGKDLNTETAKLMFHLPPETDTKQHLYQDVPVREIAKTINNGLSHGLGVQYLAGCINIPKEEARQLLATYFQIYPGVARWLKQATRLAYQQGYVASRAGRKCVLSTSRTNRSEQVRLERTTRSYPIQATKNDILKRAITIIYDVLPAEAHLVLVVHNEIVIECPEPLVAEVCDLCKAALVQACQADLKLVRIPEPEVLVGPSWKKNGR